MACCLMAPSHYLSQSWLIIAFHQMETFSVLLDFSAGNSPVTGEFPSQTQGMLSFDVFFDLRLNQQLSKQWRRRWFEMSSRSLWRHFNALVRSCGIHLEAIPHETIQRSVNEMWYKTKSCNKSCSYISPRGQWVNWRLKQWWWNCRIHRTIVSFQLIMSSSSLSFTSWSECLR